MSQHFTSLPTLVFDIDNNPITIPFLVEIKEQVCTPGDLFEVTTACAFVVRKGTYSDVLRLKSGIYMTYLGTRVKNNHPEQMSLEAYWLFGDQIVHNGYTFQNEESFSAASGNVTRMIQRIGRTVSEPPK